jgi:hypothetical protein
MRAGSAFYERNRGLTRMKMDIITIVLPFTVSLSLLKPKIVQAEGRRNGKRRRIRDKLTGSPTITLCDEEITMPGL